MNIAKDPPPGTIGAKVAAAADAHVHVGAKQGRSASTDDFDGASSVAASAAGSGSGASDDGARISTPKPRDDERMFGYYLCEPCNRRWSSGHSWVNVCQKCEKCGQGVLAYRQVPRDRWDPSKKSKIDPSKPHPQHLCGKCIQLGHSCIPWRIDGYGRGY